MLGPKIYSKKEPKRYITQKSNLLPKIVLKKVNCIYPNLQGVSFNWSYPKNYKFFSVSEMLPTFELVPP